MSAAPGPSSGGERVADADAAVEVVQVTVDDLRRLILDGMRTRCGCGLCRAARERAWHLAWPGTPRAHPSPKHDKEGMYR